MLGAALATIGTWVGIIGGVVGGLLGAASFVFGRMDRRDDLAKEAALEAKTAAAVEKAAEPKLATFTMADMRRAVKEFADEPASLGGGGGGGGGMTTLSVGTLTLPRWLWLIVASAVILLISLVV